MTFYNYSGGNQCISFTTMSNKPAQIVLMQYERDTNRLIEEAFNKKESFGLPVFMITVMQDMPQAMLSLMSRDTYLIIRYTPRTGIPPKNDLFRRYYRKIQQRQ